MKRHSPAVLFFCLLAILSSCSRTEPPAKAEVVRPVRVERITLTGGNSERTFSGFTKSGKETKLSFKVAGTLKDLKLKVGDQLAKGQLIASLEAQDQSLQVQSARANVAQVEAQLRNAVAQYDRIRSLYANNNATRADLDSARTARDSAQATLSATKKQLELAQAQAGKTVLRSPVGGVVAQVNAESGENVSPGQAIVVVNSGARPEVEVAVPETLISDIKLGQQATVTVAALAAQEFPASVTEVGVTTGDTGTTYPVVVRLKEETEEIRSGMAAQVRIMQGEDGQKPRLYVDPKAVSEDLEGRHAFVAVPTDAGFARVERRPVMVEELDARGLRISKGLKPGELLITAGLTYLANGQRVRLPKDFVPATDVPQRGSPDSMKEDPKANAPASSPTAATGEKGSPQ
jgi:membrane fusion protein, multidrug efflux system